MTQHRVLALALLGLFTASQGLAADGGWSLRLYGFYMGTGDTPVVETAAGATLSTDNTDAAGAGVSAEYRFGRRLGLEIGAWIADHGDFRARTSVPGLEVEATDTMTNSALSAGVNYHLTPDSPADLHVGALFALVSYDDLQITHRLDGERPSVLPDPVKIDIDTDLAFGLDLGLDLQLGETDWILYADLRYLVSSMGASTTGATMQSVDYDPVLVGIGFGYRF